MSLSRGRDVAVERSIAVELLSEGFAKKARSRVTVMLATFSLWKFVMVYTDDMIVFSKPPGSDLDTALSLRETSGVTLSLKKCHFDRDHGRRRAA
jgi:hypothetical protein